MLVTNGGFVMLSLLQPEHMILILVIVLLLFGGKKIPELMRGLGRGVREFNDAKENVKKELEEGIKEKDQKPLSAVANNDYNEYLEWKKQQDLAATKETSAVK